MNYRDESNTGMHKNKKTKTLPPPSIFKGRFYFYMIFAIIKKLDTNHNKQINIDSLLRKLTKNCTVRELILPGVKVYNIIVKVNSGNGTI